MQTLDVPRIVPLAQGDDDDDEFNPFAGEPEDPAPPEEGDDRIHGGESDA